MTKPMRGVFALNGDAFSGADVSQWADRLDWCVYHAPEPGPDENARRTMLARKPTLKTLAYQEFGESVDDPNWTTGMSTDKARSAGFLAKFGGNEGVAYAGSHAIDMGAPGWGKAIAALVISRLAAVGGPPYFGVMWDDVNVFDNRLPNKGLPDAYANSASYAAAARVQIVEMDVALRSAGYESGLNVGGISEWEAASFPCDTLVGLTWMTNIEHAGVWPDGSPQGEPIWTRIIEASRRIASGRVLNLNADATTVTGANFNDALCRCLGTSGSYGSTKAPWPWQYRFEHDYGPAATTVLRVGNALSRQYQTASITVDLSTLDSTITQTTPPTPPAPTSPTKTDYLASLQTSTLYKNWAKQNPGDETRFNAFVASPVLPLPKMTTAFGRAIVIGYWGIQR